MLLITTDNLRELIETAEAAYPEEACALLLGAAGPGDRRQVSRILISPNLAEDKERNFEIDPGLRIGVERDLRNSSERIVGIWHSHPNGRAEPSAIDLASAYEPEFAWLITAVRPSKTHTGEAIDSAAYLLRDDGRGFRRLDLLVVT